MLRLAVLFGVSDGSRPDSPRAVLALHQRQDHVVMRVCGTRGGQQGTQPPLGERAASWAAVAPKGGLGCCGVREGE